MIKELNGFTYSVHLLDKHCFEITYRKKGDELYQTKKTFIYRLSLNVDGKHRRNIVYKDFILIQEKNKEFKFIKCFDNNLEKFDKSFDVYNEKVEEIRVECENIIGCNDNEHDTECLDINYLNSILFAPYFRDKNVFILNYLDEQIEEISKELEEKINIELTYEVKKSCSCGNESKSIKDFKPLSLGWCYEALGTTIDYKCNKCGKNNSGWDNINLSLLVKLGYVKDNRPDKYKYKL